MISKNIKTAINSQINAELWSAYLYLSMSMEAEAKRLRGIANWFFVQWLEEQDHARIFQKYLFDRGARVELKPIDKVQQEWGSVLDMFRDTLKHEKEVTSMINDLVKLAKEENDYATLSRLMWFIDEQVEEERSAEDLMLEFEKAGEDYGIIREIDSELAARKYKTAEPLKE